VHSYGVEEVGIGGGWLPARTLGQLTIRAKADDAGTPFDFKVDLIFSDYTNQQLTLAPAADGFSEVVVTAPSKELVGIRLLGSNRSSNSGTFTYQLKAKDCPQGLTGDSQGPLEQCLPNECADFVGHCSWLYYTESGAPQYIGTYNPLARTSAECNAADVGAYVGQLPGLRCILDGTCRVETRYDSKRLGYCAPYWNIGRTPESNCQVINIVNPGTTWHSAAELPPGSCRLYRDGDLVGGYDLPQTECTAQYGPSCPPSGPPPTGTCTIWANVPPAESYCPVGPQQ
jgi:hypothetical protein